MKSPQRGIACRGRARAPTSAASLLLLLPGLAAAETLPASFDASLALVSDYMLRGVSQSKGGPAVQGGLELSAGAGWRAGLWASNIDFVDAGAPSDGADLEVDAYVARAWDVGERISLDTTLVRYAYPGTAPGVHYDYSELVVALHFADVLSTRIYYSNDAYATREPGVGYEVAGQHAVTERLDFSALIGHYDLDPVFGGSYSYYSVGLSRRFGELVLGLRYDGTDRAGTRLWGDDAADRFVVQISTQL